MDLRVPDPGHRSASREEWVQTTLWPTLERALLFGPLSPISFRLQGRDSLADAAARTAAAAASFGAIRGAAFTPEERGLREAILPAAGAMPTVIPARRP